MHQWRGFAQFRASTAKPTPRSNLRVGEFHLSLGFSRFEPLQEASSINADLNEEKRSEESGLPSVATEISGGLSNVTDGAHTLRITSKSTATGTGG